MEQNLLSELEDELNHIDVESIKLDAIIQLRTWQKKMYSLIDKTYKNRLSEIDSITINLTNEIKEKQNQIENHQIHDQKILRQLKNDINLLKSNIQINESIPENLENRIERTVRVSRQEETEDDEVFIDDDEDEPVIVDIDQHEVQVGDQLVLVIASPEQSPVKKEEGRVSKVLNSEPVQRAIAASLARAITQMGTTVATSAATSTATVAATTMAKTAIIATVCGVGTVAYGVGKLAMGTTRKVWSLVVSSDE
jgi:hypothetical protein